MTCSARRQSTGLYRMMISVLVIGILFTHHAVYGSASEHQQHQQEAIIDPSGQMEFSSSNEAVDEAGAIEAADKAIDEAGAIKAAAVEAVAEAGVDHPEDGDMETCMDVSLIEKEREDLQAKLAAAEERLLTLQKEADSREADHFAALGSCGTDKDALFEEVVAVREEARALTEALKEAQALAEKAAAEDATQQEKDEAARLAVEKQAQLESKLVAFQSETDDLRTRLSETEAKAQEALEDALKHADGKEDVRRELEKTASELEIAQKPRKVSVAAILADLRHLFDELVHQSADARDDIVSKGTVQLEKAIKAIQPYWKTAREAVDHLLEKAMSATAPQREKAMSATAPQREKAAEVVTEYWRKVDDAVVRPAGEKWTEISSETSKVAHKAWEKWQAFEVDLHRRLINAGLSKGQADKVTKYTYFGVMATVAVILLLYLTKPVLCYVVIPLVRTVLRWALWLIYLPIRILLVWPVKLIVWLLTRSFRLVFGKSAGKGAGKSAGKGTKAPASKASKGRAGNGKATTGTSGKKRR